MDAAGNESGRCREGRAAADNNDFANSIGVASALFADVEPEARRYSN
jgi:hypothetical protein